MGEAELLQQALQHLHLQALCYRRFSACACCGEGDPDGGFPNGATKAVEDAFHVERVQEQKSQASRLMSPQTAWVSPVRRKVLGSLHSYEEIGHAHVSLGAEDPKQIPRHWYSPERADLSDPQVLNIVSTRQIPSWPTFTPQ